VVWRLDVYSDPISATFTGSKLEHLYRSQGNDFILLKHRISRGSPMTSVLRPLKVVRKKPVIAPPAPVTVRDLARKAGLTVAQLAAELGMPIGEILSEVNHPGGMSKHQCLAQ
jgi:hypothetical protein